MVILESNETKKKDNIFNPTYSSVFTGE